MVEKREQTPMEAQAEAQRRHGYGSIHLGRIGDWVEVSVRVGDLYIPVIRELHDGAFSHWVEPLGIEEEIARFFAARTPLFEFADFQHWVCAATKLFRASGHTSSDTVCIDSTGRMVLDGRGFTAAEVEGTYPVKVYSTRIED